MSKDPDSLTYNEFAELCEQAGITTDDEAQLRNDFHLGKALADVTDELISDTESRPDASVDDLLGEMVAPTDRDGAIKVAARAIRWAALKHDDGEN